VELDWSSATSVQLRALIVLVSEREIPVSARVARVGFMPPVEL